MPYRAPPWCNVPNLLTLTRLALVPFILRAILEAHHVQAVTLFAIAAVTDAMDGAAARRFDTTTKFGAYLDPIADKCLMSGVFLALALARTVPWWFVAVVFGRDFYILLAVALIMVTRKIREFPPSIWGKVSTLVQIVTAVILMAQNVLQMRILSSLSTAMLWPCLGFTIWSGIHYTWIGVQLARAR